jgi:hypothetical protein
MGRLICVVLICLIGFIGCVGINGGNQQTGGDDMLNRPSNVQFEGTGVKDPNSEL